jgi:hypothetical protein
LPSTYGANKRRGMTDEGCDKVKGQEGEAEGQRKKETSRESKREVGKMQRERERDNREMERQREIERQRERGGSYILHLSHFLKIPNKK